ncbi:MAG: xanthine phosphoribosyltransferase [Lachnospiraceae bacterium]|nr:xanthine phosphoribosyltransferase [Lachnospiraceae bacterium]
MKALEEKILKEGTVLPGNILKVGSFLNQQIDAAFLMEMGKEIARLYENDGITKVLTIEASGIAIALAAAAQMNVPMLFAKKTQSLNQSGEIYTAKVKSYTHGKVYDIVVPKEYLLPGDRILIVDDFLAVGNALRGLIKICEDAGATFVGCVAAIEKGFQHGGDKLREEGYRVDALALVDEMTDDTVTFRH